MTLWTGKQPPAATLIPRVLPQQGSPTLAPSELVLRCCLSLLCRVSRHAFSVLSSQRVPSPAPAGCCASAPRPVGTQVIVLACLDGSLLASLTLPLKSVLHAAALVILKSRDSSTLGLELSRLVHMPDSLLCAAPLSRPCPVPALGQPSWPALQGSWLGFLVARMPGPLWPSVSTGVWT